MTVLTSYTLQINPIMPSGSASSMNSKKQSTPLLPTFRDPHLQLSSGSDSDEKSSNTHLSNTGKTKLGGLKESPKRGTRDRTVVSRSGRSYPASMLKTPEQLNTNRTLTSSTRPPSYRSSTSTLPSSDQNAPKTSTTFHLSTSSHNVTSKPYRHHPHSPSSSPSSESSTDEVEKRRKRRHRRERARKEEEESDDLDAEIDQEFKKKGRQDKIARRNKVDMGVMMQSQGVVQASGGF